jgi:uncharacterized protein YukE
MSSNGMQASRAQDLRAGISALNMADSGISRIVADVQGSKYDLGPHWAGDDAQAFQQLVDKWLGHAARIQNALRALEDQMTIALGEKAKGQATNVERIQERSQQSDYITTALNP